MQAILHWLSKLKPYLINSGQLRTNVMALVLSEIDYRHLLFYGINQSFLGNLQIVQNCAAVFLYVRKKESMFLTPSLSFTGCAFVKFSRYANVCVAQLLSTYSTRSLHHLYSL